MQKRGSALVSKMEETKKKLSSQYPVITGVIIALLILLFLDLFFGSIGKYYDDKFVNDDRFLRIYSPVYHHGFAPLKHYQNARWGDRKYEIKTNSLGFKDSLPHQVPLTSSNHRIVFIGDSFTEGIGVPFEDTFVGIIDRELKKQRIEVFNAAVISYSPTIYYAKIKHLIEHIGFSFDELVVFLDINDVYDDFSAYQLDKNGIVSDKTPKIVGPPEESNTKERFIWNIRDAKRRLKDSFFDHTILLKTLHMEIIIMRPPIRDKEKDKICTWTLDKYRYESYGLKGLQIMQERMSMLADMLKKRGIKLTIAVYPWPYQIQHRDIDSIQVRFWRKWADERKAGFINYFPHFINKEDAEQVITRNFIKGDEHWNEAGHRLIAEGFLSRYKNASSLQK